MKGLVTGMTSDQKKTYTKSRPIIGLVQIYDAKPVLVVTTTHREKRMTFNNLPGVSPQIPDEYIQCFHCIHNVVYLG